MTLKCRCPCIERTQSHLSVVEVRVPVLWPSVVSITLIRLLDRTSGFVHRIVGCLPSFPVVTRVVIGSASRDLQGILVVQAVVGRSMVGLRRSYVDGIVFGKEVVVV